MGGAKKEEEEEGGRELGRGGKKGEGLTPWEQHSAVISIPRFDYRVPSSLLQHSHSGFLVTCPIKREKSATKEALSIFEEYIGVMHRYGSENLEPSRTKAADKKRKVCSKELDPEHMGSAETEDEINCLEASSKDTKETSIVTPEGHGNVKRSSTLSLVKLNRSGLLLFMFPNNNFRHTVKKLSNIFHALESGTQKPPLWCHRIFPFQETCILIEEDLHTVVSKLVKEYLDKELCELERPIKFAVGFNRRGIDETETKSPKVMIQGTRVQYSKGSILLDRDKCFQVVAAAIKAVAKNSAVDLRSPELVVLVEALPISGVPHGSIVVGVSVLPHHLIATKPRLCVKPLVSDAKPTKSRD